MRRRTILALSRPLLRDDIAQLEHMLKARRITGDAHMHAHQKIRHPFAAGRTENALVRKNNFASNKA